MPPSTPSSTPSSPPRYPSPREARLLLARRILGHVDGRLSPEQKTEEALASLLPPLKVPAHAHVVLVGHRASGKSRLLPLLAAWCGRVGVDLDRHLEQTHRRELRAWFAEDTAAFRAAEREAFRTLPLGRVVACGGGFLSLHADLLEGHVPVLLPVSFETYCERLSRDKRRPRLRPELPLEEELRQVFLEREVLHARTATWSLFDFVARTVEPEGSFA